MHGDRLKQTPLHALHVELGGRMVPFAGYDMPVQYPPGVLKEHQHTRTAAGLFDVSHMGQALLKPADGGDPAAALETLVPGAIQVLKPGRMRYTLLLNEAGGILDDLMVTRTAAGDGTLYLVVNAACKDADFALIAGKLAGRAVLERLDDRALIALQGPAAAGVLGAIAPAAADLGFMEAATVSVDGAELFISRSGYTGEDGFEISVPADAADVFARRLLDHPDVWPIGLGARDSLRLEAGLCLYGHDIDQTTSPVEASLVWALGKKRREAGDFPGADRILRELADGPARVRVGLMPEGRAIAREGADIVDLSGSAIGTVTSGGFGPTTGGPVAMGYVAPTFAEVGTRLGLVVRGRTLPARVAAMPFVQQRYVRRKTA